MRAFRFHRRSGLLRTCTRTLIMGSHRAASGERIPSMDGLPRTRRRAAQRLPGQSRVRRRGNVQGGEGGVRRRGNVQGGEGCSVVAFTVRVQVPATDKTRQWPSCLVALWIPDSGQATNGQTSAHRFPSFSRVFYLGDVVCPGVSHGPDARYLGAHTR